MSGAPPKLSIVVVSFSAPNIVAQCLRAIADQCNDGDTEITVVRSCRNDSVEVVALAAQYPQFNWIVAAENATVPQMRKFGIEHSSGEITALLEDDCVISQEWRKKLIAAHDGGHKAVGGAVEPNQYGKGLDWGIFFCEYARFLPPFEGRVFSLPGNNLSYKRTLLQELAAEGAMDSGFYEVFVNSHLNERGENLWAEQDVSVRNISCWQLSSATSTPFHHGRGFAAMRFPPNSIGKRACYAASAFLLPGLQSLRICSQVLSRKRYTGALLRALPSIVLFWTSWSCGEFMGYLLGPGHSLEQWR